MLPPQRHLGLSHDLDSAFARGYDAGVRNAVEAERQWRQITVVGLNLFVCEVRNAVEAERQWRLFARLELKVIDHFRQERG